MQNSVTIDSFPKEQPRTVTSVSLSLSPSLAFLSAKKRRGNVTLLFIRISRNAVASVSPEQQTAVSRCRSDNGVTKNTIRGSIQNHFAPYGALVVYLKKRIGTTVSRSPLSVRNNGKERRTARRSNWSHFPAWHSGQRFWECNYFLKEAARSLRGSLRATRSHGIDFTLRREVCRWNGWDPIDVAPFIFVCNLAGDRDEKSSFDEFHSSWIISRAKFLVGGGGKDRILILERFHESLSSSFLRAEEERIRDSFLFVHDGPEKRSVWTESTTGWVGCPY